MTDARAASPKDELEVDEAPEHALHLPAGLRADWPAPRVGVSGRRGGVLAALEAAVVNGAIGGVARLPAGAQDAFVAALARLAFTLDRRHTNAARAYVRQALGTDDARSVDALVRASWRHLLRVTLDSAAFAREVAPERVREHFDVRFGPDVQRLLASKQGSIVVGAHVGDWEAGAAVMPWLGFDPFYAISRPPKNRPLSVRVQTLREARGIRLLPRRGAMRQAPAVLRAGGTIAMLLDQRARSRPVMAEFFGRRARCDRGAGVLLKRVSAPVVFVACYRAEGRFRWRLEAERVLWPEEAQHLSVEELVLVVNRELERMISKAPEQYFWLHDRYRGAEESAAAR
ncbi:MAG: lysophospholipid acyltransferase family protein [Planctomycetes bacterium]|nr:lysophospholipid acyltransferase family protein [Planctomycetota bacterium]